MQKNNQNIYSDYTFDYTCIFYIFLDNEKSSKNATSNCFCLVASTGIEPVFPP